MPIGVITGGSSGIGLALAVRLAEDGTDLVLTGRDAGRLEVVAALAREHGVNARGVVCDVRDLDAMTRLAQEVGAVDVLVLNAAVTTAGPLVEHSAEDWAWVMDTVLGGVANGVQAFLPAMLEAGNGRILITASFTGLVPDYFANHGPYAAAKAGVVGLGVALRGECAPHGVKVSLLIPAGTDTRLPGSHIGRPSVASGSLDAAGSPDPMQVIRPRDGAPALLTDEPGWLDPDDVAAMAIAGLRDNAEFIITHPEFKPVVEEYYGRILAAFDASPRMAEITAEAAS
jgi:3-oxoacyl-[acyl-carrier protein] reductase